jgi:hypothetical protein
MKILIKAIQPHRQKVLTHDGEEVRLQRWANKKANRDIGTDRGKVGGAERFTQARDKLMYDAVANPEEHGLKFINERVPFEGQNLESLLSEPNVESEMPQTPDLFDSEGKLRDGMPPEEEGFLQANNKVTWKDMPSEERTKELLQQEEFKPDAEAEHMRRIMTSRQVPMRDAWSILKFGYPSVAGVEFPEEVRARHNVAPKCKVCQGKLEEVHPGEGEMVCMNANCPAQMMIQSKDQPPRLRFPAESFPTGNFNSLEEMTENARNNPDYSQDLGY